MLLSERLELVQLVIAEAGSAFHIVQRLVHSLQRGVVPIERLLSLGDGVPVGQELGHLVPVLVEDIGPRRRQGDAGGPAGQGGAADTDRLGGPFERPRDVVQDAQKPACAEVLDAAAELDECLLGALRSGHRLFLRPRGQLAGGRLGGAVLLNGIRCRLIGASQIIKVALELGSIPHVVFERHRPRLVSGRESVQRSAGLGNLRLRVRESLGVGLEDESRVIFDARHRWGPVSVRRFGQQLGQVLGPEFRGPVDVVALVMLDVEPNAPAHADASLPRDPRDRGPMNPEPLRRLLGV